MFSNRGEAWARNDRLPVAHRDIINVTKHLYRVQEACMVNRNRWWLEIRGVKSFPFKLQWRKGAFR